MHVLTMESRISLWNIYRVRAATILACLCHVTVELNTALMPSQWQHCV